YCMKRVFPLILVILSLPVMGVAQTGDGSSLTLQQCIDYALENSINIKNAVLDEEIADARVKETRGIGLPQIDATVGVLHNQKLPRFYAQHVQAQPGEEVLFDLSGIPGIEFGDVVAMQNFFQLKSSGNAALSIN